MLVRPINKLPDFVKKKLVDFHTPLYKNNLIIVIAPRPGFEGGENYIVKRIYARPDSDDSRIQQIRRIENPSALKYMQLADVVFGINKKIYKNRFGNIDER